MTPAPAPALAALRQLRAIRDYAATPLRDTDLEAICEAARATGTERNRQRWAIVVVADAEQRSRLADCGDHTEPLRRAPCGMALVQEPDGYEFDIGRIGQNVMLAAAALGIASCPVTLHRDAEARPVLDLDHDQRVRYVVALGHPAAGARPALLGGRRPIGSLVHHDKYTRHPRRSPTS